MHYTIVTRFVACISQRIKKKNTAVLSHATFTGKLTEAFQYPRKILSCFLTFLGLFSMWKDQRLPSSHVTWWQWKSPCSTGSTSTTCGCYDLWIRLAKVVVGVSLMFQVGLSSFWFKIPLQVCCAYLLTSNMRSPWNLVHEEIHRKWICFGAACLGKHSVGPQNGVFGLKIIQLWS